METPPNLPKTPRIFLGVVPPSGGSLEIGNFAIDVPGTEKLNVPPSGGSLEIGNRWGAHVVVGYIVRLFPLRGDP